MRILLVFLACFGWMFARAQTPTNNTCSKAASLLFDQEGRICVVNQNTNPTASGFNPGTSGTCTEQIQGPDLFYRFIAVAPTLSIKVNTLGAGSIKNPVIYLLRGNCNSFSLMGCATELGNNPAELNTTVTPGQAYFIAISSETSEFGDFELCVTNNQDTNDPGDRCDVAGRICNKATLEFENINSYQESGIFPDCFSFQARRDVWITWTVSRSGTCEFLIDPIGNAEYDWALFDVSNGCPDPSEARATAIACNYNYAQEVGAPTGMAANAASFPAPGEISNIISLTQGKTYALLIDNFSRSTNGFSLEWGGTFEIISSDFEVSDFQGCDSLEVSFDHPILIDHEYQWDFGNGTTFNGANPPDVKYTEAGSYIVSLNVSSNVNGCNSVSNQLITVSDPELTTNFTDTTLCGSQALPMIANAELTELQSPLTFTNNNDRSIPDNNTNGISSSISVALAGNPVLENGDIQSVCVNIQHGNVWDLELTLEAPDSTTVTLVANKGEGQQNLFNTCFSDAVSSEFSAGSGPYSGTFKPQEDLSTLNGINTNGTWKLHVKDGRPGSEGLLDHWAITFKNKNEVNTVWSPSDFFPDSTATEQNPFLSLGTDGDTTYQFQVSITDKIGCSREKQVSVSIVEQLFAGDTGNVTRCTETGSLALGDYLKDGYVTGGTWSGIQTNANLNASTGNLNYTGYTAGIYEFVYSLENFGPCSDETGHVFVDLREKQDAGKDTAVFVCQSTGKVNLFEHLGGNPDPGGTWTDLDESGSFNPITQELNPQNLAGNYRFQYAFSGDYTCAFDTAILTVSVIGTPEIYLDSLVCTANNDSYRVYATIVGGDTNTYQVSPANGVINGQQFISNSIFENTPFSFTISDNVGCPPGSNEQITISGNYDCDCITESGGLIAPTTSQDLCFNDSVIFIPDGNHRLDGNDGLMAVLHSAPGTSLGTIYETYPYSDSIVVRFDANTSIPAGERIYFSVIAGDAIGDSVDLADPSECLDVSNGIPVTLRNTPYVAANILGFATVCEGTHVNFRMELFEGTDPFRFTVNGDTTELVYQNDTISALVTGAPQAEFVFANLTDKFGCTSDTVFTQVRNSVQKITHDVNLISCDPNNENYQVLLDIDRDLNRNMEQRGAVTYEAINDTLYQSEFIASGTPYNALFNYETGNCPDDTVSGIHTCPCGSFAGALADIPSEICAQEVIRLQETVPSTLEPNDALNFVVTKDTMNRSSFDAVLSEPQLHAEDLNPANTYFVAILVGDSTSNGLVDSQDTCKSFSTWKKVTILPNTSTSFNLSNDSICSGSQITVFANFLQPLFQDVTVRGKLRDSHGNESTFSHTGTAGDFGTNFNLSAPDSGVYQIIIDSVAYNGDRFCAEILDEKLTFYSIPRPSVSLAGNYQVCPDPGVSAKIPVRYIQGIAPLDLTVSNGNTVWVEDILENSTDTLLVDLPSGDYKLYVNSLTGNSSQQCNYTNSDTARLRVLDKPTLSVIGLSNPICEQSQFDITLGFSGNDAPYSIAVFDVDNNSIGSYSNISDQQVIQDIDINQQQTVVVRNFSSNEGCRGDDFQYTVTASPRPAWINPQDTNVCEGSLARIQTQITGNAPFDVQLQENGIAKTYTGLNNVDLVTLAAELPENEVELLGITDVLGCTSLPSNSSFKIFRRPIPNSSLQFSKLSGCGSVNVLVSNTTTNTSLDACRWELNDNTYEICDTVTYTTEESEVLLVDYTLESIYGCRFQNVVSRNLVVHPKPNVAFTASPMRVSTISPVVTFSNQTPGENSFVWRFGNLDSTQAFSPIYEFPSQDTGSYKVTLRATNEFECIDSTSQIIKVSEQITVFIPNSFSPNNDGRNDVFKPGLVWDDIARYELTVFNRWGEVVYQTRTNNRGWDGQFQNRPAPKGSYNFLLKVQSTFEEKVHTVHGTVLLVR